jgi:hypothetical protein
MTLLLLVAALLGGQPAATDSGILLGLDDGAGDARRYATFLISNQDGRVSLLTLKDRLLVPRRDGFWWMSMNSSYGPTPAVWRVGAGPTHRARSRAAARPLDSEALDETGCSEESENTRLEFVNGPYVALERQTSSVCNGRSNRSISVRVQRYTPEGGTIRGTDVAIPDAIGIGLDDLRRASQQADGGTAPVPEGHGVDPRSWSIQRGFGQWEGRGALIGPGYGSIDWRYDFDLPNGLPSGLISNPPLNPPWDVILDAIPDARDAFASPTGTLLVVLTATELRAYVPHDGRLGLPVLRWTDHNPNPGLR